MKYLIFTIGLILGIILSMFIPYFALASFDTNLRPGSVGPKVVELQDFLRTERLFTASSTGNFLEATRAAVVAFQTREGIAPASGYFYSVSRARADYIVAHRNPPPPGTCDLANYRDGLTCFINGRTYTLNYVDEGPNTIQFNFSR